jgi:predicted  nucleic acid-binding Zn-ribbon protein
MSFLNELKATAGQVFKKVGETVGDVKDWTQLQLQIRQVNQQIQQAHEATRAAHEAMGRRVYQLHKEGQTLDSKLVEGCQEVETLAKRIDELSAQVAHLEQEHQKQREAKAAEEASKDPTEPPKQDPGAGPTA